jgi:hypothetical protein
MQSFTGFVSLRDRSRVAVIGNPISLRPFSLIPDRCRISIHFDFSERLKALKAPQQTGRWILPFLNNQITNASFDDPIALHSTYQGKA